MTCFSSLLKRRNPGGFFAFRSFSADLSWFFSMWIIRSPAHTSAACRLQTRAPCQSFSGFGLAFIVGRLRSIQKFSSRPV
jgi:hypothetical protein